MSRVEQIVRQGTPEVVQSETKDSFTTEENYSSIGSMGTARQRHGVAVSPVSDTVLIFGGRDGNNNTVASAEEYDPSTDSYSSIGSMGTARQLHGVAVSPVSDTVLIFGGYDGNNTVASAEEYQPFFQDPAVYTASENALFFLQASDSGTGIENQVKDVQQDGDVVAEANDDLRITSPFSSYTIYKMK